MVLTGTTSSKTAWTKATLASKLGVAAAKITAQSVMVAVSNGDIANAPGQVCAWIDGSGNLKVNSNISGAARFEIHVLYVGS